MLRTRMWCLALVVLVAGLATAVPAQQQKSQKKGLVAEEGAIQVMLLRQQSVRDELKLTDDEAKKIHEFADRQWKKAQHIHEKLEAKEHHAKYEDMTKENDRFIHEILEPAQLKRLNGITMQVAGLLWVTHPEVAAELKLTDEQKQKAKVLQQEARDEMHDLIHVQTKEGRDEKLAQLRQTSRKRLDSLLTDEQKARWKEMAGEPFRGSLQFEEHVDK